jgi:hypothetical protein
MEQGRGGLRQRLEGIDAWDPLPYAGDYSGELLADVPVVVKLVSGVMNGRSGIDGCTGSIGAFVIIEFA